MIKKIQFGGISRTPSERLVADGGCAESMNMVVADGRDAAPVLEPLNVMSDLGLPTRATQVPYYIHKTYAYTNYIAVSSYGGYLEFFSKRIGSEGESWGTPILSVNGNEVKSITSIGNTLIILTDRDRYYLLYKDGAYKKLGTRIPEPIIKFTCTEDTSVTTEFDIDPSDFPLTVQQVFSQYWQADALDGLFKKRESNNKIPHLYGDEGDFDITYKEFCAIVTEAVWRNIGLNTANFRADGVFVTPVLARYAVKLYNGQYIYNSVPILLGAGMAINGIAVKGTMTNVLVYTMTLVFNMPYRVDYSVIWEHDGWNDIVSGVDIFLSTDINVPKLNAGFGSVTNISVQSSTVNQFRFINDAESADEQMRDEILSKANFYLVESIEANDADGANDNLKPWSQDALVVRQALPEDYLTHHDTQPLGEMTSYNQRLVLAGVKTTLYAGHPALQSTKEFTATDYTVLILKYYIRTESGEVRTVISVDEHGAHGFSIGNSRPYSFLCYPDPNCYRVDVYNGNLTKTYPMKPHPMLNIAYYYGGITTQLIQGEGTTIPWDGSENSSFTNGRRLMMSDASNPFLFSAENYADLEADILGTGLVTKPLSTGQFGQHTLYIFTAEGIYVIGIAANGIFASAPILVSRDVAIKGTICMIEQAVVFASEQGEMLLAGSAPKNISPQMNGRHYVMETEASAYLAATVWERYAFFDATPFLAFIKSAKAVYDYAGRRIIFFSTAGLKYQYVYLIDYDTWHKTCDGYGRTFIRALNNYPDAYVVEQYTSSLSTYAEVINYSTPLDAAESDCLPGIIATRELDLDHPDLYKRITRIRIRGDYGKDELHFLLLGSVDGRNYRVIHSLRGPSWKFFRLIVLTGLRSFGRISYAEIEYETAFTDRIR